jgi:Ca2+-binding EF-hand superfamily protein
MKTTIIASMVTVLAASSLAFAHGEHGGLARFDRDGNGIVSKDEMRAAEKERFEKMDVNHDGRLTLDEIAAVAEERASKRFAKQDKNGDGQLSRAEVARMPDAVFARLDQNRDGSLSKDELTKGAGHAKDHAAKRFAKQDKNGDGAISADEAQAGTDERFARMDKNGDGLLTQDELKAHGACEHKDGKAKAR